MRKSNKSGSADGSLMIHSATLKKGENRYRAIYHPLRQKIVAAIHKAGRINVSKLNQKLKEDKSLLSQHLKTLRDASIVISQRDGQHVFYIVNYNQLNKLMKYAVEIASIPKSDTTKLTATELNTIRKRVKRTETAFFSATDVRIIKLICDQKTNEEISEELGLSKRTVEDYRRRIIKKMKMKNTAGLVLFAVKSGLYKY
jgi:DNA-binding CsgD family transcriptional regulator/DNA-binding transcriptional ArsR family regulator